MYEGTGIRSAWTAKELRQGGRYITVDDGDRGLKKKWQPAPLVSTDTASKTPTEASVTPYDWSQTPSTYARDTFDVPTFGGKYAANDTWAEITRRQWEDYLTRFAPLEEKMIGMTTYANPDIVGTEVGKGQQAARQAIQTQGKISQQYMSRYGAAIDPRAEMQRERMQGLTASVAVADAASRIRQNLQDQNRQIAFGMASAGVKPNTQE